MQSSIERADFSGRRRPTDASAHSRYPLASDGKTLIAALIGRWHVHDGAITHFAYFEQNATAVTVGIDGHIVVTDLRIADRPIDDSAGTMPRTLFSTAIG